VVFSIDDGETSFVGAAAQAGGRPAEGGGRRAAVRSDGGGRVEAWRLQNRPELWRQRAESGSEELNTRACVDSPF
jgi:hypothetical protein